MSKNIKTIKVNLKTNPYSILIGNNLFRKIPAYLKNMGLGNFGVVITSPKVYSLYKSAIKKTFKGKNYKVIVTADGEKVKTKEWMFKLLNEIIKLDTLKRKIFIVCLGGGTIGDLGGFVAATYRRGISYVQVPTTLLAQVDASIGGKTAIDLKEAKNIVGAFHQPKAVFIDPLFLRTLPTKEFREGMAEVVKYGIIRDKAFFGFLQRNSKKIKALDKSAILKVLTVCAKIKAEIVAKDEREAKGLRTILNYGHTFAHAFETALKYKKVTHGQAVAVGMICAGYLSYSLDKCRLNDVEKIRKVIDLFSLPVNLKFDPRTVYKAFCYDKKFIKGKIRLVILKTIGKVEVLEDVPAKIIQSFFNILAASD